MNDKVKNDAVEAALKSKEFTDKIDEAVPYRVKINTEYCEDMKNVRNALNTVLVKGDKRYSELVQKKMNKSISEEEMNELKSIKAGFNKRFVAMRRIIHPNKPGSTTDDAVDLLVKKTKDLVSIAQVLKFAGIADVQKRMNDAGISIQIPDLESENEYYKVDGVKDTVTDLCGKVDEVQGAICQAADEIKITLFEQLPANIRYSKEENKKGIKPSQFQNIVKTKATKEIKGEDKFRELKEKQAANGNMSIIAKSIETAKIEDL